MQAAAGSDQMILTLTTPDGFKVAFALSPSDVDGLVTSLTEGEPACQKASVVN